MILVVKWHVDVEGVQLYMASCLHVTSVCMKCSVATCVIELLTYNYLILNSEFAYNEGGGRLLLPVLHCVKMSK